MQNRWQYICYLPFAGQINASTYPLPADSIESASNPANPEQVADDPASAYPKQPAGYPANNPSANPEQAAGYPTYSSAYPQQPNVSSAYLLQPMGAQTVTVDQPKHVSVEQV